jgi:hypothetical protein
MSSSASVLIALILSGILLFEPRPLAHSGPPFPIVSNHIKGAYEISIWTDPDTTDDATPGGQFWITLNAADKATTIPPGTEVNVEVRPLDRPGPATSGRAAPLDGAIGRQFVALRMDHEGPFAVRVTVDGQLGRVQLDSRVDATYDSRPSPGLLILYVLPFLAVGALWAKVLLRRRNRDASPMPRSAKRSQP